MRLFHVTVATENAQSSLHPRIPMNALFDEEIKTPRISLAPSIKQCLQGIQVQNEVDDEGSVFVWVYKVDIDEDDDSLIKWPYLYEAGYVSDSPLTKEHWYKAEINNPDYSLYKIYDIKTKPYYIFPAKDKEKLIDVLKICGITEYQYDNRTAFEIFNDIFTKQTNKICMQIRELFSERVEIHSLEEIELRKQLWPNEHVERFESQFPYFPFEYVTSYKYQKIM